MRGSNARAFAFVVHSLVRMLIMAIKMAISNRARHTWLLFTVATFASAAAAGSPTSVPTAECVSDLGRCGAGSDSGLTACCESDQSVRLLILT